MDSPVQRDETFSTRSNLSIFSSAKSMASLEAARAKAKAEAAKARAQFLEKESLLKKQQALLKIDLEMLNEQKLCAEAEAEANAYQNDYYTIDDTLSDLETNVKLQPPQEHESSFYRTQSFVKDNFIEEPDLEPHTTAIVPPPDSIPPNHVHQQSMPPPTSCYNDLTSFLLRKELLLSRFQPFNDDPSTYQAWKISFNNTLKEISLHPQERLDILINHLSSDSKRQALSISTSNAGRPDKALLIIWQRLDERFGAPELIESLLKKKLACFPTLNVKDDKKFYELLDLLCEIQSLKEDRNYSSLLSYFDTSSGINPIVQKLPNFVQRKWIDRAFNYKETYQTMYPTFEFFVSFIRKICKTLNDPSLNFVQQSGKSYGWEQNQKVQRPVSAGTKKTDVDASTEGQYTFGLECPLHVGSKHSLNDCREFSKRDIQERKQFIKEKKICYKCCDSDKHYAKNCEVKMKCDKCSSFRHPTALHSSNFQPKISFQGEDSTKTANVKCTELCGNEFEGRSCAKTFLVKVYPNGKPDKAVSVYAIVDDQSNCSLATSDLLDKLNIKSERIAYQMASCSGTHNITGRKVNNSLCVSSSDGSNELALPTVLECNSIPQNRLEIPTPEVAQHFPHLRRIASYIPPLTDAAISLLIGRDLIEAHQVQEQITGSKGQPFAQRLMFGWVVIGEVCLGKRHYPRSKESKMKVTNFKTHVLMDKDFDRVSIFEPCVNYISSKEIKLGQSDSLFLKSKDDEKLGLSIEDRDFLKIMDQEMTEENGHWVAPLPFKLHRQKLPNNKIQALNRAKNLQFSLQKNPTKMNHFVSFMANVLDNGHAEVAPLLTHDEECWYLPIFGVYHPKKPGKVRVVFDSSASFEGVSLNSVLLQGPDLTNNLLSILIRFRMDAVAVTVDIEQMFYSFSVADKHKNFLRFFWYEGNDPTKPIIEYRMCRHVFGNSPSPAVAAYALRKSVENSVQEVKKFIHNDFYVDDGLSSQSSPSQAVALIKKTQKDLSKNSLRLHKIASNDSEVMKAFDKEDLALDLKSIDFDVNDLPTQRSLGLEWDLNLDAFVFKSDLADKPVTKRGILSTINSIFDPLGFLSPIILNGKLILRDIVASGKDWDESLSPDIENKWVKWKDGLKNLNAVQVPRCYIKGSLSQMSDIEFHIFSDASEKAIASVVYVLAKDQGRKNLAGFVMGKSKVAPSHGHTIPRLELCACLLATQLVEVVKESLNVKMSKIQFYTDSRVVLGYLNNRTRRFHNYVSNRVQRILSVSRYDQWFYVSSQNNPADCGTRGLNSFNEVDQKWISAPKRLLENCVESAKEWFPLITPEEDKEIRVQVAKSVLTEQFVKRFERFSDWGRLVKAFALLIDVVRGYKRKKIVEQNVKSGSQSTEPSQKISLKNDAESFIIRQEQSCMFADELESLWKRKPIFGKSSILCLNPYLDEHGIIRVKGRLQNSSLPLEETNPVILSRQCYIAKLLVRYFHEGLKHQGRLLTEGGG